MASCEVVALHGMVASTVDIRKRANADVAAAPVATASQASLTAPRSIAGTALAPAAALLGPVSAHGVSPARLA